MFVCEVDSEGSEDLKGQKSDSLEVEFLFFGQLRPFTADSATDSLREPLYYVYYVEAKAGFLLWWAWGGPSDVPKAIGSLVNLVKMILVIMGSVLIQVLELALCLFLICWVFHQITDQEAWWQEFGF